MVYGTLNKPQDDIGTYIGPRFRVLASLGCEPQVGLGWGYCALWPRVLKIDRLHFDFGVHEVLSATQ